MAPRINARIHTYTKMCIHFFCTTYLLSINTSVSTNVNICFKQIQNYVKQEIIDY